MEVARDIGAHIHSCSKCETIFPCLNTEAVCPTPDETVCNDCWSSQDVRREAQQPQKPVDETKTLESVLAVGKDIEIAFPEVFHTIAKDVGAARMLINKRRSNRAAEHDRKERGEYVDYIGVLGEILGRHYLQQREVAFKTDPLVTEFPQVGADFLVANGRIDVKCVGAHCKYFIVTKHAHESNQKNISHYWFMWMESNTVARSIILNHLEVSKWPVHTPQTLPGIIRFEPGYTCPIGK